MKTLEVTVLPIDFKNAPRGYFHSVESNYTEGCVLWHALHRLYPNIHITVGGCCVDIGDSEELSRYVISENWGGDDSLGECSTKRISELSIQAKKSLEGIPEVLVTLTPSFETII